MKATEGMMLHGFSNSGNRIRRHRSEIKSSNPQTQETTFIGHTDSRILQRANRISVLAVALLLCGMSVFVFSGNSLADTATGSPSFATTTAEAPYIDVLWVLPSNVYSSDNLYASTALSGGFNTYVLYATDYGFSIPLLSTINGITLNHERAASTSNKIVDDLIQLVKGGTRQGDNKSAGDGWTNAETIISFGGNADLWGLAWTAQDINATDFGVAIAAKGTGVPASGFLDHLEITVDYTPPFEDSGQSMGVSTTYDVFAGDFDGDGDLDYVESSTGVANKIWTNDGAGTFTDSGQTLGSAQSRAAEVFDADGDGDMDYIESTVFEGYEAKLWLNNGAGIFSNSGQSIGSGDSVSLYSGDVDADGDIDFVSGNYTCCGDALFLNDGAGNFTDSGESFLGVGVSDEVAMADIDGDGDLDILQGWYSGSGNKVYENDGAGGFTNTGQLLGSSDTDGIFPADLDADGYVDFYAANRNGDANETWINDGSGTFFSGQTLGSGNTECAWAIDVDNDGDLELIDGDLSTGVKVWVNDAGTFIDSGLALGACTIRGIFVADFDGDDDPDILTGCNSSGNKLYTNLINPTNNTPVAPASLAAEPDINPAWGTQTVKLQWVAGSDAETADTDLVTYDMCLGTASGECDVFGGYFPYTGATPYTSGVFGNVGATTSYTINIYTATTTTYYWTVRTVDATANRSAFPAVDSFTITPAFSITTQSFTSTSSKQHCIGDIDGDGDMDIAEPIGGAVGKMWLNNGAAAFSYSGLTAGSSGWSMDCELVDIDGDGDLDYLESTYSSLGEVVFTNNGSGTFSDTGQSLGSYNSNNLLAADADMDGDIDFFESTEAGLPGYLWINNGNGVYSNSGNDFGTDNGGGYFAADVDADGDTDVWIRQASSTDKLFLNDGDGNFTDSGQAVGPNGNHVVVSADVDGDNDVDAVFVADAVAGAVWLNNGAGIYTDSGQSLIFARNLTPGDFDGDGDIDFASCHNQNREFRVLRNDGTGSLTDSGFVLSLNPTAQDIQSADFDGDGDLDVSISNQGSPNQVIISNINHANTAPAAPTLTAEADVFSWAHGVETITLDWSAGSDAETTNADLLTYDVRIGTAPDTCDVFCGFFPSSGTTPFLSAVFGNVGAATSTSISLDTSLTTTYYWTARTVDATKERSAFPAVDSFTITPAFEDSGQSLDSKTTFGNALADLDGDGDLDYIAGNTGLNVTWENDGTGTFSTLQTLTFSASTYALKAVDVDMDGDLDVVEGNYAAASKLWINNGAGNLTVSAQDLGSASTRDVALGDMDGDGDPDLVIGNYSSADDPIWTNDGTGAFTLSGQVLPGGNTTGLEFVDFDNDGDLDLIREMYQTGDKTWRNDGGTYVTLGASADENIQDLAVADMDGDGDMDYVHSKMSNIVRVRVKRNDGSGTFSYANSVNSSPTTNGWEVELADLDGDGDIDIADAGVNGGQIWGNDGTGDIFQYYYLDTGTTGARSVAIGDLDADGDVDIVYGTYTNCGDTVWFNNVNHASTAPTAPALTAEPDTGAMWATRTVTLQWTAGSDAETTNADLLTYDVRIGTAPDTCDVFCGFFPSSGTTPFLSAVFGNAGATTSYSIGLSAGTYYWTARTVDTTLRSSSFPAVDSFVVKPPFEDSGQTLGGTTDSRTARPADVDSDGDIDIVESNYGGGGQNNVWINDGSGTFSQTSPSGDTYGNEGIAPFDVDGDGDIDYVEAVYPTAADIVYLNDGSGTFTDSGQTLGAESSWCIAPIDVDNDGDIDFFEGTDSGIANKLYLNDGDGTFTDSGLAINTDFAIDAVAADLDKDGDIDVAYSANGGGNRVVLNNGDITFTDAGMSMAGVPSRGMGYGDFNADGYLDLYFSEITGAGDVVWFNDGDGTFTSSQTLSAGVTSWSFAADFDGDGDTDVAVAVKGGSYENMIYINDGSGTFSDSGVRMGSYSTWAITGADFDGDGDVDLFEANQGQTNRIWINNINPTNTAPTAPALTAEGDTISWGTETVSLGWTAGSDAETTDADLLTYDVCIGTASGDCDVYSGFFPFTGATPYLSAVFGNAGATTTYSINLNPVNTTTYYWSARTVDATIKSSAWDTEDSFTITPAFEDSGQVLGSINARRSDLADVDGDGDMDVIISCSLCPNKVWLNNGAGTFSDSGQSNGGSGTQAVTAGDLDGDGDMDYIESTWDNQAERVWKNNGNGSFSYFGQTAQSHYGSTGALGDVDGDGDLDYFELNQNTDPELLWLNNGNASFTVSGTNFGTYNGAWGKMADLDDDGDLDLALSLSNATDQVWINNGAGTFTNSGQEVGFSGGGHIVATDVDGDRDLDLVFNTTTSGSVWLNDGSGSFTDSGQSLPDIWYAVESDYDGDGDIDLLGGLSPNVRVALNDGSGTFSDSGFLMKDISAIVNVKGADFDADGDTDIFIARQYGDNLILVNNINPTSTTPSAPTLTAEPDFITWVNSAAPVTLQWSAGSDAETTNADLLTYDVRIGTATNTCDIYCGFFPSSGTTPFLSAVFGNAGATTSYSMEFNVGSNATTYYWSARTVDATKDRSSFPAVDSFTIGPAFEDSGQSLSTVNAWKTAPADVDGDGDMDLMISSHVGGANRVWINTGGTLSDSASLGTSVAGQYDNVAAFDVDGDGDIDAVIGKQGAADKVYLNDGAGAFSDSGQSIGTTEQTQKVIPGDYDRDGDLDYFAPMSSNAANKVWLNDGTGTFTDSGQSLGSSWTFEGEAADYDGDGDLDVAVGNSGQPNKIWLNDGSGTFSDSGNSLGTAVTMDMSAVDVEGDGNFDLVSSNGDSTAQDDVVWMNDGAANFTSGQVISGMQSRQAHVGDLDGDGDMDLYVLYKVGGSDKIFLNDGSGTFSDSGFVMTSNDSYSGCIADFDGDGDLDLYEGTTGTDKLWINNINPTQTAPVAPSSLVAEPDVISWGTETVKLDWAAGSDAETTNAVLLTYDLRIGTAPDTCDVFCGFFPSSGTTPFLSAVFGNAGATTSYSINLNPTHTTTFYWTARTVDATKERSTFPAVDSFKIAPAFEDSGQTFGSGDSRRSSVGDFDGDGDFDILESLPFAPGNQLWLNDGTGVFSDSGQSLGTSITLDMATADLDGDGDLDFMEIIYNDADGERVWLNDGNGNFTDSGQSLGSQFSTFGVASDIDKDGDMDVLVTSINGYDNKIWVNDGSASFSDSGNILGTNYSHNADPADVDGDGDIDVLIAYYDAMDKLWLNDGTGTFTDSGQAIGLAASHYVSGADVDGDNDTDALYVNESTTGELWLNSNATFTDSGQSIITLQYLASGDYDGDGDIDFAGCNRVTDELKILLNDASGTLTYSGLSIVNVDCYSVDAADFDGDGDLDITTGNSGGASHVYINNLNPTQTAPAAPGIADVTDSSSTGSNVVTLSWSAGSDAETTNTDLLTYDVRIGTASGACDVFCGFFPSSGTTPFLSAEFGNVGATTTYFLNLNPSITTTYYWSARTVDATKESSAWDTEDTFTVHPDFEIVWSAPITRQSTYHLDTGDTDGDGDLDIIIPNSGQQNQVYQNDGSWSFSNPWNSTAMQGTYGTAFGDYDGDGYMDHVAANGVALNRVYHNDGDGTFTVSWTSAEGENTLDAQWADYDGDGDLDFIESNMSGTSRIRRNDGSDSFTTTWTSASLVTTDIQWADYDRDGDMDFTLTAMTADNIRLFRNDGGDSFSEIWISTNTHNSYSCAWADYNADGLPDIFETASNEVNRVYRNNGDSTFTNTWTSTETDRTTSSSWGDYDGDGDLDIFVGNGTTTITQANRLYRNDGGDSFALAWSSSEEEKTFSVKMSDMDGDGDLDFVTGNYGGNSRVYRNNLNPANTTPNAPTITAEADAFFWGSATTLDWGAGSDAETTNGNLLTYDVCIGTASGDCDVFGGFFPFTGSTPYLGANYGNTGATTSYSIDLAPTTITTYYWTARTVDATVKSSAWDTEDSFVLTPAFEVIQNLGSSDSRRSAVADVDADGDFDIIESISAGGNKVWLNNSAGTFSDSGQAMGSYISQDVNTADVDGDGDIDIVEATWGQGARIWLNDSAGTFSNSGQSLGSANSRFGSLADMDSDGDIDYLDSADTGQANKLWVNNGSGTFSDSGNTLGTYILFNTDVEDIDNDGDLDVAGSGDSTSAYLWTNDGTGVFTDTGQLTGIVGTTYHVIFGDMDGDGNADVITGGTTSELWTNDGTGTFTDTGQSITSIWTCDAGDLDGDGDIDLMTPSALILNNGAGILTDPGLVLTSPSGYSLDLADFDGDGDLDATSGNQNTANLVYRNNLNHTNTIPFAPTPAAESDIGISGGTTDVHLQWSVGSDTETSAALLTYDVRMGTTSGGCDVYCGFFTGSTPWLGLSFGNAGASEAIYINNLGHGIYYWSVRTVDITHTRSAWSAENSFSIDATPPSAPAAVYDGPETGLDFFYASSTTQLSASWDDSTDPESGIAKYWYAIGTTAGATNVVTWTDNGAATSVTKTGLSLTDANTYYFTVKVQNGVAVTGTAANSDGQLIDVTAPSIVSVTTADTEPDGYLNTITITFDENLVGSGEVADWTLTDADTTTDLMSGLLDAAVNVSGTSVTITLANNTGTTGPVTYTYSQAGADNLRDAAGVPVAAVGATVSSDNAAPVFMGSSSNVQIESNNLPAGTVTITFSEDVIVNGAQVTAADWTVTNGSWHGGASVTYADGAGHTMTATLSSGTTSNDWDPASAPRMDRSSGALANADSIEDAAGNDAVANAGADELIIGAVDYTPPTDITTVYDGAATGVDGTFATSSTILRANWAASTDPETGIADYQYAVGTASGATDVRTWTSNGTSVNLEATGLTLADGVIYYITVKAVNGGAMESNPRSSAGQLVDASAPVSSITSLSPGAGSGCQYLSAATTLFYNNNTACNGGAGGFTLLVSASDAHSGIMKVNLPTTVSAGADDTATPYSITYTYDSSDTYSGAATATAYNNNELTTESTFDVIRDVAAPVTSDDWTDNWTFIATVTVTLTPTDGTGSGIQGTLYCTDTTNTCTPASSGTSATFTCPDFSVCENYIRYYSTDNVNNAEAVKSERVRQDRNIPSAGTVTPANTDSGTHVDLTFDLTTNFTSSGSDVQSCDYCLSLDASCDTEWASATFSAPGTASGTCSITGLSCTDGATATLNMRAANTLGNTGYGTAVSRICDGTAPSSADDWTDSGWSILSSLTVNLSGTDSASGLAYILYCIDSNNSCTPASSGTSPAVTCADGSMCTQYLRYLGRDAVGNIESVNSQRVRQDLKDPTCGFTSPAQNEAVEIGSLDITGFATDENFLEYSIYYGPGANPASWATITATSTSVLDSSGTLPTTNWDTSTKYGTYTVRIRVADQGGNFTDCTRTVGVSNPMIVSGTITAGQWTMISIPGVPYNSQFSNYLTCTECLLLQWDESSITGTGEDNSGDPIDLKYKETFFIKAGDGFWVKAYGSDATYSVSANIADTTQPFEIDLKEGWNQIGTPFNREYDWNDVTFRKEGESSAISMSAAQSAGYIETQYHSYENGTYVPHTTSAAQVLTPVTGYFVRAKATGTLVFDPGAGMPGGIAKIVRPKYEWRMRIEADAGEIMDTGNYIGEMAGASDDEDTVDAQEPPGIEPYVSLAFLKRNDGRVTARLAQDIQAADTTEKTWEMQIFTSEPGSSVTITWPDADGVPDHYEITITDTVTGDTMNPKETADYSFVTNVGGVRNFQVTATRTAAAPTVSEMKNTLKPGWNLVSVPLEPYSTDVRDQLGKIVDTASIFQYYDGKYYTPDSVEGVDIQAGISYWIYTTETVEVEFNGLPVSDSATVDVPLKVGYNFIGVPFSSGMTFGDNITLDCGSGELSLSDATGEGIIHGRVYSYDPESGQYEYTAIGGNMDAWEGYVAVAYEACTLKLKK